MIRLIKLIIWTTGAIVVALFVLDYFGYEVNRRYFDASARECQNRLDKCKSELIQQGTKNARCDFDCVDPKLIIKKK